MLPDVSSTLPTPSRRKSWRLAAAADDLQTFASSGVGKSIRNDTPSHEVSDEVAQLVDLMVRLPGRPGHSVTAIR